MKSIFLHINPNRYPPRQPQSLHCPSIHISRVLAAHIIPAAFILELTLVNELQDEGTGRDQRGGERHQVMKTSIYGDIELLQTS